MSLCLEGFCLFSNRMNSSSLTKMFNMTSKLLWDRIQREIIAKLKDLKESGIM